MVGLWKTHGSNRTSRVLYFFVINESFQSQMKSPFGCSWGCSIYSTRNVQCETLNRVSYQLSFDFPFCLALADWRYNPYHGAIVSNDYSRESYKWSSPVRMWHVGATRCDGNELWWLAVISCLGDATSGDAAIPSPKRHVSTHLFKSTINANSFNFWRVKFW